MRCCSNDGSYKHKDIATENEPSAAKQIAVRSADHECDCNGSNIARCEPAGISKLRIVRKSTLFTYQVPDAAEAPNEAAISDCIVLKNGTGQNEAPYENESVLVYVSVIQQIVEASNGPVCTVTTTQVFSGTESSASDTS